MGRIQALLCLLVATSFVFGESEQEHGVMDSSKGSGFGGMDMSKPAGGYGGYDEDDMCCPIKHVRGGNMNHFKTRDLINFCCRKYGRNL